MAVEKKLYTAEEFEEYTLLPENAERLFELIGGEIVEVPSNPYSSFIASRITMFIGMYLLKNDIGYLTGESGSYRVSEDRYAPDAAFISYKRQAELPHQGYNPKSPDLAVEVVSPSDSHRQLMQKVANYLAVGTLVWVVYPEDKEIEIYAPGQNVKVLDANGTLDGGTVLPGFALPVQDIFPPSAKSEESQPSA